MSQSNFWKIKTSSTRNLSDADRDLIVAFADHVAMKSRRRPIILDEVIESKRTCELWVEASKISMNEIVAVLRDNLPFQVVVMN